MDSSKLILLYDFCDHLNGLFLASAPPGPLRATLFPPQIEALCVSHVEVQLAHNIGGRLFSRLETCTKLLIASTVGESVESIVEVVETTLKAFDDVWTSVVLQTTTIRRTGGPKVGNVASIVSLSTPVCSWEEH